MPVTLTANYKEIFAAETVSKIDEFLEENYCLEDMLEFIDERSEDDFVSFYEDYVTAGENIGYDVVDAFVGYHGISYVEHVEEAYHGSYNSEADFAEEYYSEFCEIPCALVIDWQATWDSSLRYDFDFVEGFVFQSHF
jgi:hypothetical protein